MKKVQKKDARWVLLASYEIARDFFFWNYGMKKSKEYIAKLKKGFANEIAFFKTKQDAIDAQITVMCAHAFCCGKVKKLDWSADCFVEYL